jgi:RHH-type rel operon transcriptional repressor/antitoxin RelB
MTSQTVRLPEELAKRLEQLASTTKRSKTSYIVEALERHLDECEDLELALSRFRDPNAEWIEHDDVRKELGLD